MSLHDEIRKLAVAAPDDEPQVLAGTLLDRLPREELTDLIADEIRSLQRAIVRTRESDAFHVLFEAAASRPGRPIAATPEFRSLFKEEFAVGDGTKATWGKATIDQHRFRVQFLTNQIEGLTATRARHEWAVTVLEQTGANCLEEISGIAAPIAVSI
jgi:hypothetical protein